MAGFLKRRAPLWHQVGQVCFHLAENRRDPVYPFAFLATYAPAITASSRIQYQPLSSALRQYSGQRDKKTLVNLLSPVHVASQRSAFARELIESGDIYQPVAWTPSQAIKKRSAGKIGSLLELLQGKLSGEVMQIAARRTRQRTPPKKRRQRPNRGWIAVVVMPDEFFRRSNSFYQPQLLHPP